MLVELFILLQIIAIILWFIAFYTEQEIIWAITAVFFGTLMISAWSIEILVPIYNATISAYDYQVQVFRYSYLSYLNILFFSLTIILGFFDIWQKYIIPILAKKDKL